jgi:hypothetical protein
MGGFAVAGACSVFWLGGIPLRLQSRMLHVFIELQERGMRVRAHESHYLFAGIRS